MGPIRRAYRTGFLQSKTAGPLLVDPGKLEIITFHHWPEHLWRVAGSTPRIHAPATLRLQSVARRGMPSLRWPHRVRASDQWNLSRCARRLARCRGFAEVFAHLRERDGPDAAGVRTW